MGQSLAYHSRGLLDLSLACLLIVVYQQNLDFGSG